MNERISIPRDAKSASGRKDIFEVGRKWFPPTRESVSTKQNEGFVVKINLH